ncbi:MAG: hypothetical protein RL386_1325, partial [Bacteroidota bacterium]
MQACLQETFGMEFHQELIEKAIEQLRARYAGDDFAF